MTRLPSASSLVLPLVALAALGGLVACDRSSVSEKDATSKEEPETHADEKEVHLSAEALERAEIRLAPLERRALGLLRSRARRAGLVEAHARWLAHLDLRAIGAIPDVDDGA